MSLLLKFCSYVSLSFFNVNTCSVYFYFLSKMSWKATLCEILLMSINTPTLSSNLSIVNASAKPHYGSISCSSHACLPMQCTYFSHLKLQRIASFQSSAEIKENLPPVDILPPSNISPPFSNSRERVRGDLKLRLPARMRTEAKIVACGRLNVTRFLGLGGSGWFRSLGSKIS